MKSKMTDFLFLQKSKFNGQLINASGVFTGTASSTWLKYSYKYRRTLMRFMIYCHQLHVSWCTAAIMQMPTFKQPVYTHGLRWKFYLPFPWIIMNAGWVVMILWQFWELEWIGHREETGIWSGHVFGWHLRMSPVLSSLFPALLHSCQRTTLNPYNIYCCNNTNGPALQL